MIHNYLKDNMDSETYEGLLRLQGELDGASRALAVLMELVVRLSREDMAITRREFGQLLADIVEDDQLISDGVYGEGVESFIERLRRQFGELAEIDAVPPPAGEGTLH